MTDNEIIKALECCISTNLNECYNCPFHKRCEDGEVLEEQVISLINRQKAEIERLKGAVQEWVDGKCISQKHLLMIGKSQNEIASIKAEAIKEFAESAEKKLLIVKDEYKNFIEKGVVDDCIDTIKETVGEYNNLPIVDKQN